uniref:Uncharacterized protein n=1 Tax=Aegilops tauschii subsp. strangulata TaxID=200361 RepID=A0A453S4D7_AEGTS
PIHPPPLGDIHDLSATLFWFDRWAGDSPFTARFPDLFSIAVDPRISVVVPLLT